MATSQILRFGEAASPARTAYTYGSTRRSTQKGKSIGKAGSLTSHVAKKLFSGENAMYTVRLASSDFQRVFQLVKIDRAYASEWKEAHERLRDSPSVRLLTRKEEGVPVAPRKFEPVVAKAHRLKRKKEVSRVHLTSGNSPLPCNFCWCREQTLRAACTLPSGHGWNLGPCHLSLPKSFLNESRIRI